MLQELKRLAEALDHSADDTGCTGDLIVVGRAELYALLRKLDILPSFGCEEEEN